MVRCYWIVTFTLQIFGEHWGILYNTQHSSVAHDLSIWCRHIARRRIYQTIILWITIQFIHLLVEPPAIRIIYKIHKHTKPKASTDDLYFILPHDFDNAYVGISSQGLTRIISPVQHPSADREVANLENRWNGSINREKKHTANQRPCYETSSAAPPRYTENRRDFIIICENTGLSDNVF